MRRLLLASLSLLLFSGMAAAQKGVGTPPSQNFGHIFLAPGWSGTGGVKTLHLGFGGERLLSKGLGIGGRIGYLFVPEGGSRAGVGLFSVNGSYHFWKRGSSQRLVPFVTGGYSLAFRNGSVNLMNFAGGVTHWFSERVGLRLEFRDYLIPNLCGCGPANSIQFSMGVALR